MVVSGVVCSRNGTLLKVCAAFIRPQPKESSRPAVPLSSAYVSITCCTWAGEYDGFLANTKAANPAAIGVAIEVPPS